MKFTIPQPLQNEHQALHERLREATEAGGVTDPLAELLGAAEGGRIEYRYLDAVKLAGHSCPTVAGAWLMTRTALARLYPDGPPQRGGMRVELRQAVDEGVTGVIASVAGLITGAANDGGFKGLAGRFGRQGLLRFGVAMAGEIRFTRLDNGSSVELAHFLPLFRDLDGATLGRLPSEAGRLRLKRGGVLFHKG